MRLKYRKVYESFMNNKETIKDLGNVDKTISYMCLCFSLSNLYRFALILKNFL